MLIFPTQKDVGATIHAFSKSDFRWGPPCRRTLFIWNSSSSFRFPFQSELSFDITIHYSCMDIMSRALLLHDSGFVFDIDVCLSGRPWQEQCKSLLICMHFRSSVVVLSSQNLPWLANSIISYIILIFIFTYRSLTGLITGIRGFQTFTLIFICEYFRHWGRIKHSYIFTIFKISGISSLDNNWVGSSRYTLATKLQGGAFEHLNILKPF